MAVVPGAVAGALLMEAVKHARALWHAQDRGIPLLLVGKSEARQLDFPPGHPRENVVYVGHPALPASYNTIANFHRVTFEHKFREAISLLMNLGATQICVEHVSGWSKEFSSRLSVPLGEPEVDLSATAHSSRSSQGMLLFEARLSGTPEPKVPDELVWYPHEQTWQAVAEGRMKFGLRQFSLNITYEDDYGINAEFKTAVSEAGLKLGGNFEDHRATTWKAIGKFLVRE